MFKIRVPATSANLGPGFDCLGIALGLYNTFEVEPYHKLMLEGVEKRFANEENLFMKAFRTSGGTGGLHVKFHYDIPISRGLGSSASLYTAGALSAMALNETYDRDELFRIVSSLEGHPDNAAPAVYGGLTASMSGRKGWVASQLPLNENLRFTVLVPDFEVETSDAVSILPDSYPRGVASGNAAKAVFMTEALRLGDIEMLRDAARDQLHEPYRKTLIPNFETVKAITENDTGGALVISGSGSTCLLISDRPLSSSAMLSVMTLPEHWAVQELPVSSGPEYAEDDLWQAII